MAFPSQVEAPEVIRVDAVSKHFRTRRDNSLKERIVHFGRRGRAFRQDFTAISDVSIGIEAGTTVGLLGANGSGKSTLLKLIGGIVSPTTGVVQTRGHMAALLELGAGFHPDLSGRENVYLNASILGLTKAETDAQFDSIVEFSGVGDFIETQVKFYSSGMFVRLAFAVAVHTDPDILLVDEVLAVGDEAFQRKCMDRIAKFRSEGRTIVLVSHSAAQVSELCDRGIVLKDGEVVFDGAIGPAVSALRDVLEGRRVGEAPAEITTYPLEVKGIELCDSSGQRKRRYNAGDPMIIRIHLDSLSPLSGWEAGFSIDTPMGQMVLASNTKRLETRVQGIDRPRTVEFMIESLQLGSGEYFVNANATHVANHTSHALMQGAMFTVESSESAVGTVAAQVAVTSVQ